jgi:hypothetical protein
VFATPSFLPLTPQAFLKLQPENVSWPVGARDWRQWGDCAIAGDWSVGCGWSTQYVAVPSTGSPSPEYLGFGPGWITCNLGDDPRWTVFHRTLDPDGRLQLWHYPWLPPHLQAVWAQYRYEGLPIVG